MHVTLREFRTARHVHRELTLLSRKFGVRRNSGATTPGLTNRRYSCIVQTRTAMSGSDSRSQHHYRILRLWPVIAFDNPDVHVSSALAKLLSFRILRRAIAGQGRFEVLELDDDCSTMASASTTSDRPPRTSNRALSFANALAFSAIYALYPSGSVTPPDMTQ